MELHAILTLVLAELARSPQLRRSAAELATALGVSAQEIAEALATLREWGIVQVEDGEAMLIAGARSSRTIVLLVENTPAVANVAAALLEAEGYAVLATASLETALRVLSAAPIALVIADSFAMTAAASVEKLQPLLAAAGRMPVLLFTAHRDLSAEQARAAGFAGLLPKPFDIDEMLAQVADAIARARDGG